MSVSSPTELLAFLQSLGVEPKKSLSQNFLIDKNIIKKIAAAAAVSEKDTILEIGAGPGALTEELLALKAQVVAVEKDRTYAEHLLRFPGLKVFEGDIRDFSLDSLKGDKKAKVVANLPYHLTSPILGLLLPRVDLFSTLTLMVQKEVALRMLAKPNTPDYSALTVFINFYTTPHYDFTVSRNCFYPAPKVDSSVVTLNLKESVQNFATLDFFAFVKTAFQQKRKMLRGSLKSYAPSKEIEDSLKACGTLPTARPEDLDLEKWIALFKLCQKLS